jgi:hypothetical protein
LSEPVYLYKFQIRTSTKKGQGGTNGGVYFHFTSDPSVSVPGAVCIDEGMQLKDQLHIPPEAVVPLPGGNLKLLPLKMDTPDAPHQTSFEMGDIDICYFYIPKPAGFSDLKVKIYSTTKADAWSYQVTALILAEREDGTRYWELAKNYPERTTYVSEGSHGPGKYICPVAACHIDVKSDNPRVSMGGERLPAGVKIDEVSAA